MRFIATFLLLFAAIPQPFAQNADIDLLREIHVNRNENLDPGFKLVTHSIYPFALAAPATMLAVGWIQKDSSLIYKGAYVIESLAVSTFVTIALKYSVQRERPFVTYPEIEKQTEAGSLSFPSGHTSTAFALATSMSISFPKWYVIAPSFLWAGTIGYSRMHLGVHYPGDVLAGAIIGSGTTYLTHVLNKRIFQKRYNTEKMYINLW